MSDACPQSKRQVATDLPPPEPIADADMDELCATFRIPPKARPGLKAFLNELISVFTDEIIRNHGEPDLRAGRDRLKTALAAVERAQEAMGRSFGPSVRQSMHAFGPRLGPMVAAQWLRDRFSEDERVPQRHAIPIDPQANRLRYPGLAAMTRSDTRLDVESLSRNARVDFVESRPADTALAILQEIQDALQVSLNGTLLLPNARGGRKPLTTRHYVLINLAEAWSRLGQEPTGGTASRFLGFCEAFFELIGWPHVGLSAAVSRAIRSWQNLAQKTTR